MLQQMLKLIIRLNWFFFLVGTALSFLLSTPMFARGVTFGGLIVTINFHLLERTLKKAFQPGYLKLQRLILIKYYIRFFVSGLVIFFLIQKRIVNPLGLFIGLSIVVASITITTTIELKKLFFKEAI